MDPFIDTQLYIENYKKILEHAKDCYWLLTENEMENIYSFSPRQIELAQEYEIGEENGFDSSFFYELVELQDQAENLRFQYDLYVPCQDESQSAIWQERMDSENKLKIESIHRFLGIGPECHYKNFVSFLNTSFKPYKRGLASQTLPNGICLEKELEKKISFAIHKAQYFRFSEDKCLLEDLIMCTLERISEEAYRFDSERGFTFGSYLNSFISRYLNMMNHYYSNIIYFPPNVITTLHGISKIIDLFWKENQRNPGPIELAEISDIPIEKIIDYLKLQYTFEDLEKEIGKESNNILFDEHDENGPFLLYETIEDEESERADKCLIVESLNKEIDRTLNRVSKNEIEILKMFFGIGCSETTLEEIGYKFGICKERVRQIKETAIRKLKGENSKALKQYLGIL